MDNLKFITVFVLFILCVPIGTYGQQDCQELIEFRDGELFEIFDAAFEEYSLNQKKINRLKNLHEDLKENNWFVISGAGTFTLAISGTLTTTSDLILDLVPGTPAKIGKKLTSEILLDYIEKGKKIQGIVEDGIVYTLAREAAAKSNPITQIGNAFVGLFKNIKELTDQIEQAEKLRSKMLNLLTDMEEEIETFQGSMNEAYGTIELVNKIKNEIDSFCNK